MANGAVSQISQSAIKSIQRGEVTMDGGSILFNIAAVNKAKSIIRVAGFVYEQEVVPMPTGWLENNTQCRIQLPPGPNYFRMYCYYEIIEFN